MIFAKTDVDLPDHPRALRLGDDYFAGLGLWQAALCWIRKHTTDGIILREAPFLQRRGAERLAKRLVEVGLWGDHADGFELLRYAAKNETKAEIDERLKADRARKEKAKRLESDRIPIGIPTTESDRKDGGFPGSASDSGSSGERVKGEGAAWKRDPMGASGLGSAWAVGVRIARGGRGVTAPSRGEIERIVAAVEAHAPEAVKLGDAHAARESWVRESAGEWIRSSPSRCSVFAWSDWLNAGGPSSATLPAVPPPPARKPAEVVLMPDDERKRLVAELEAAASGTGLGLGGAA